MGPLCLQSYYLSDRRSDQTPARSFVVNIPSKNLCCQEIRVILHSSSRGEHRPLAGHSVDRRPPVVSGPPDNCIKCCSWRSGPKHGRVDLETVALGTCSRHLCQCKRRRRRRVYAGLRKERGPGAAGGGRGQNRTGLHVIQPAGAPVTIGIDAGRRRRIGAGL